MKKYRLAADEERKRRQTAEQALADEEEKCRLLEAKVEGCQRVADEQLQRRLALEKFLKDAIGHLEAAKQSLIRGV